MNDSVSDFLFGLLERGDKNEVRYLLKKALILAMKDAENRHVTTHDLKMFDKIMGDKE